MTIIRKQWRLKWFSMNGFFIESVCKCGERRAHLLNVSDDQIPEIRVFSVEIMKYLERNCTKACNELTKNTQKGVGDGMVATRRWLDILYLRMRLHLP